MPPIWRRFLVYSDTFLSDFHEIIQVVMGWENRHLHQFFKSGFFYMPLSEFDDGYNIPNEIDYRGMTIESLLTKEGDCMDYVYDFGDGWQHEILLEKIIENATEYKNIPTCLEGENSCPPEDVGGLGGYMRMLEILEQPDHEEYEEYIAWIGEDFDPYYFNKDEINDFLNILSKDLY